MEGLTSRRIRQALFTGLTLQIRADLKIKEVGKLYESMFSRTNPNNDCYTRRTLYSSLPYHLLFEHWYVCSGSIVVTTLDCGPMQRFPVQVPSGCQYSMRLDRLHRAYPSLHPFGVVHWVQSCRTSRQRLGVNQIDSCNFELCSQGLLWITINSMVFKDGMGSYVK